MEVLANRLKWLREKYRYSQKDVADKIGMSAGGYQKIEYAERDPKLDVLCKLADIYELTTDFLLGRLDDTKELMNIHSRLLENDSKIMSAQHSIENLQKEIFMIYDRLRNGTENTVNKRLLNRELDELKNHLRYLDHNLHEDKIVFNKLLFDYIIEIYSIPFSKPEEHRVLKKYLPLELHIEEYANKDYKIRLKSLNGTDIGLLFWKQSPDKETNYKETTEAFEKYKELFRLS